MVQQVLPQTVQMKQFAQDGPGRPEDNPEANPGWSKRTLVIISNITNYEYKHGQDHEHYRTIMMGVNIIIRLDYSGGLAGGNLKMWNLSRVQHSAQAKVRAWKPKGQNRARGCARNEGKTQHPYIID